MLRPPASCSRQALAELKAAGAEIVEIEDFSARTASAQTEAIVLHTELRPISTPISPRLPAGRPKPWPT